MSGISLTGFYGFLIGFTALLFLGGVWFTYLTSQEVFSQMFPNVSALSATKHNYNPNTVIIQRKNKVRTTLIYVVASSMLFELCLGVNIGFYTIIYRTLQNEDDKSVADREEWKDLVIVAWISDALLFTAHLSLNLAYIGRYQSCFASTQYCFSVMTMRIVYTLITICIICGVIASVLGKTGHSMMSLFFAIPGFSVFVSLYIWEILCFFRSTRDVASDIIPFDHQSNSVVDNHESVKAKLKVRGLLEASLRLTILATTALCSTLILGVLSVLRILWKHRIVLSIATDLMFPTDLFISIWSLVCLFRGTEKYYYAVFGRFHRYLMNKLVQ